MNEEEPVEPIAPSQVAEAKAGHMPPWVMRTWNLLIALNYSNGRAVVRQSDAVKALRKASPNDEDVSAFLNIEDVYRAVGWHVTYDKPGFNESYPSTFEFKKK